MGEPAAGAAVAGAFVRSSSTARGARAGALIGSMSGLIEKFGHTGAQRSPDCSLPAHYAELQALCDALGHAAQQEMAEAIAGDDPIARERAYGKWLGVRGILRAVEARV